MLAEKLFQRRPLVRGRVIEQNDGPRIWRSSSRKNTQTSSCPMLS
jgi:hypothetical protein